MSRRGGNRPGQVRAARVFPGLAFWFPDSESESPGLAGQQRRVFFLNVFNGFRPRSPVRETG